MEHNIEIEAVYATEMDASKPFVFTNAQAVGALPNGTRVRKAVFVEGDAHSPGDLATVIGSLGPYTEGMLDPEHHDLIGMYGYCVVWDDMPDVAVFINGNRIEACEHVREI